MSASKINTVPLLDAVDVSKKVSEGDKEKDDSSAEPKRPPSPEGTKCAICLCDVVNRSCSNTCVHQFCFGCLLEWSKVKPECPLCKSSFRSIYYNFRSNNEYDEYVVPTQVVPLLPIRFGASGVNHRLSPVVRELETQASQHAHLGLNNTEYGQGIIHPLPVPVVLTTNPFNNGSSSSSRLESGGDMMAERRRVLEEAAQMPGYQNRRRRYDRNEWVQAFGPTQNQQGSVDYFWSHPDAVNRLRDWLYRELMVLISHRRTRPQYDVRCWEFQQMINSYVGTNTAHFQHELYYFIISGMGMDEYDRVAEYPSANSSRNLVRRNLPPEIITIDSDEDNGAIQGPADSRAPQEDVSENSDVVILETSSNEDIIPERYPLQSSSMRETHGSNRIHANIPSSLGDFRINPISLSSVNAVDEYTISMPELSIGVINGDELDQERRRIQTGRIEIVSRDPEMPVLEPQIYSVGALETFSSVGDTTTIDRSRATAATTTPVTTSSSNLISTLSSSESNQNLTRPSVLSSSSGRHRNTNDVNIPLEQEFDIDLNVSVESYSSPPRQTSRPLTSPNFPILQRRRNIVDREREVDVWERSRAHSASNDACTFSGFGNGNSQTNSRRSDNVSAFVPYEPDVSQTIREDPIKPSRPSCIHGTTSTLTVPSTSSSSRDYRDISDGEEESRVKSDNKQERLNFIPSDDDTNILDGLSDREPDGLSADFNLLNEPSSPPVIDFQSSSSSSSFLNIMRPQQTTNNFCGIPTSLSMGNSAIISIPNIPSFRLSIKSKSIAPNSSESTSASNQPGSSGGSSQRLEQKHKHVSPKKNKSKRLRIVSSSEDSSNGESTKSKKSKKRKDKYKEKSKKSRRRSCSKVKTSGSTTSTASLDVSQSGGSSSKHSNKNKRGASGSGT